MPDKFHPPSAPADALYHAVLCGHLEKVQTAIRETPELIRGRTVIEVKLGDGRSDGEVAWYRADRGYGYIRDQSMHSGELFFDVDSIVGELPDSIEEETDVSFEIAHDKFGPRAVQVEFGKIMHQLHA